MKRPSLTSIALVIQSLHRAGAGRLTTFTMSGGNPDAVEQADGSRTTYTYGSSGQIDEFTDHHGNVVTIYV